MLMVFGAYFFFNYLKRQSDLDSYYSKKLEDCHYTILHPSRKMINDSLRNVAADDWNAIEAQMVKDGYSRAEVEELSSQSFRKTMKKFQAVDDKFWKELDEKYG
jgi:hypothetical protein